MTTNMLRNAERSYKPATLQELCPLVFEEAARSEIALREKDAQLAAMLADPCARLGPILSAKHDRLELVAYLKGLRFLQDVLSQSNQLR